MQFAKVIGGGDSSYSRFSVHQLGLINELPYGINHGLNERFISADDLDIFNPSINTNCDVQVNRARFTRQFCW